MSGAYPGGRRASMNRMKGRRSGETMVADQRQSNPALNMICAWRRGPLRVRRTDIRGCVRGWFCPRAWRILSPEFQAAWLIRKT